MNVIPTHSRVDPNDNDKQRAVTLALQLGWVKGKHGNGDIASAAVNKASKDRGWGRPMVKDTAQSLRLWVEAFNNNELVPPVGTNDNRGQKSMSEMYGDAFLRTLFRRAQKQEGTLASFEVLATAMNTLHNKGKRKDDYIDIKNDGLYNWFHKLKGKLKANTMKPALTPAHKAARVQFSRNWIFWRKRKLRPYYLFIDEKWFYVNSGRGKHKVLPKGEDETEAETEFKFKKAVSRRYATKVMFVGVVGFPVNEIAFDGKVCILPFAIDAPYTRATCHVNFCSGFDENANLISYWRDLGDKTDTKEAMVEKISDNYDLTCDSSKITFMLEVSPKVPASEGVASKPRVLAYMKAGETFGDNFDKYEVRVQNKAGDTYKKVRNRQQNTLLLLLTLCE